MTTALRSDRRTAAPPLHVFIVEDSQAVRERLEEMLMSIAGARCAGSAAAADAAIRGILESHADAVVLDIGLAQGTGFDVLRALRQCAPAIPVYVLSNNSTDPYRRMAQRLGAHAFFDKTHEIDAMRELLRQRAADHAGLPH